MEFYDSKDEAAPLIFHLLMKEISNTLFSKEIPKDVMELFEGKSQVADELIRKEVAGENSVWFTKYGGFTKVVHTSYENVMKKLQKEYGPGCYGVEVGRLPSTCFYTSNLKIV